MKAFLFIITLAVSLTACAQSKHDAVIEPVIRLVVRQDGSIFADGSSITLEALRGRLASIEEKRGSVWLYCPEWDGREFGSATRKVAGVIEAAALPLRVFAKEDFSEYRGADGKVHKEGKA